MMPWKEKWKQILRSFMGGRHGTDQLSMALLWIGLGLYVAATLFGLSFLSLPALAIYAFSIFRVFSRNNAKRYEENRRFLQWKGNILKKKKQATTRFQNRKEYKYFKCPGCKAWLRLPRGAGVATVTCGRCRNSFTQKS